MNIIRPAKFVDLRAIYDLQNVPFRKKVFHSPLSSFEEFYATTSVRIQNAQERYFLFESDNQPVGFIWFVYADEFWYATVWSRWVKTLMYAGCVVAFRFLNFPRLLFAVREENIRTLRFCKEFGFRFAGEASTFVVLEEPPYVGVAKLNYYDIRAEEFQQKSDQMQKQSLELKFLME